MLRQAFNALSRLHSRAASLKRLGTPDIYSPIRISPSNYFRNLQGPSGMIIKGREFIIPVDSMSGVPSQTLSFAAVPTTGAFDLSYDGSATFPVGFGVVSGADSLAADVQTSLRLIAGLENVTVSGSLAAGFTIVFYGVQTPVLLTVSGSTLDAAVTATKLARGTAWSPILKRGDRIIDTVLGHMAIDEIVELVDLGGDIMGYRCRCE